MDAFYVSDLCVLESKEGSIFTRERRRILKLWNKYGESVILFLNLVNCYTRFYITIPFYF